MLVLGFLVFGLAVLLPLFLGIAGAVTACAHTGVGEAPFEVDAAAIAGLGLLLAAALSGVALGLVRPPRAAGGVTFESGPYAFRTVP